MFWQVSTAMRLRHSSVSAALCGVSKTLSSSNKGLLVEGGSVSNTSSPAP